MNSGNVHKPVAFGDDMEQSASPDLARLYHFLELAFAHPGEDGCDYFKSEDAEKDFLQTCSRLFDESDGLSTTCTAAAKGFFAELRKMSFQEVESAYISLFINNFPRPPCPPYGSLFTAASEDKRLAEMLAIKEFYQRSGVDIADGFDDLPDHLCVELEFVQLLCFRESDIRVSGDIELLAGVQATEIEFLDRFLLPFATRLADIATQTVPDNPYSKLLEVTRCLLTRHRQQLDLTTHL